ncbi:MAG: ABC transporter transmembrane domain-containing protein [Pseudomonadota bacterium]
MHELSPSGLERRGIPFSRVLRLPYSVLVASVMINLFGLALPLAILQVYDRIIPNMAMETFALMIFGLIAIVAVEAVLRMARSYIMAWAATRFTKAIMQDLMSRFVFAPSGAFAETLPSKTIEKLSNVNRIADFYGGQSRLMFVDLPFAFLFLGVLGLIGGWLVVVPLAILVLFGFITIVSSRDYKKLLEKKEEHEARIYDFVAETLTGILTMKAQAAEPLLMRRFERLQATNAQLHYEIIKTAMQGQTFAGLLGNGTMIAMVSTGAVLAVRGDMTIGALACCSLLSGRAVQPILRVASTWNEFQSARLAIDEIAKLIEINHVPDRKVVNTQASIPAVQIENFAVNADIGLTRKDTLSVTIEPSEVVAIVAPDGSGKTTLIKSMAGLMEPPFGKVSIDGIPAYDFRRMNAHGVGLTGPDTEIFAGTIFDNISLFGHGASPETVRWATNLVELEGEIDQLPNGYDTPLGQGISETLPAGFIKRILLARVLAQKPVFWLMDEPQGRLDDKGRISLMRAIDQVRGWMTIVYSTSSEDLIAHADRILKVDRSGFQVFDSYDDYREAISREERAFSADAFDAEEQAQDAAFEEVMNADNLSSAREVS